MTRTLIPRSGGAKLVESTDFEKYFCHIRNHVVCGFAITEQCPDILAVDIASGVAKINGLHLNNTASCSVTCLTACSTNKIYLCLTRDCACKPTGFTFQSTTGCVPACDTLSIGQAITAVCTVTSVNTVDKIFGTGFIVDAPIAFTVWPELCSSLNATVCINDIIIDTSSNVNVIKSNDKTCCPIMATSGCTTARLSESFCTYSTQCLADAAWVPNDACMNVVNITCDLIDFDLTLSCTDDRLIFDLGGNINNTSWVLRFHWITSSITFRCTFVAVHFVGLSSCDASLKTCNQDSLGLALEVRDSVITSDYMISHGDDEPMAVNTTDFAINLSGADDFFMEFKRESTTSFKISIFSCSCYSCLTESKSATIAKTTQDLRFLGIWNRENLCDACSQLVGTISDIEFYNGVTSV